MLKVGKYTPSKIQTSHLKCHQKYFETEFSTAQNRNFLSVIEVGKLAIDRDCEGYNVLWV